MNANDFDRVHDKDVKLFGSQVFWLAEEASVNGKLSNRDISAILKSLSEYFLPHLEIYTKDEMEKKCQSL